ncbi:SDR family oxidoreductase [Diplocloster hominis]|uniref:SDR family oxidoreductase n=1 Tax=Diplocloster hominis TaxID=3079010 RepID=UPI0031BB0EFB
MSKKRILLTGGKGFFCSRLADYYKNDYDFLVTDKDDLDFTDRQAVLDCASAFQPNLIIHAGAIAVTDFCNQHPDIARKVNVDGALHAAEAAREVHAQLIFLSSEQVFNGNTNGGPFREEDTAVPNTVYGANKLEAEALLKEILDELWIVRFTWMFGLPERNKNMSNGILWDTLTKLRNQEKIIASPHEFRGMGYIYETIANFQKLFEAPYGTYHMGATNNESRYDTVKHILHLLGLDSKLDQLLEADTVHYLDHNRDVRLDTTKANQAGMYWTDTHDALELCLREFGMVR